MSPLILSQLEILRRIAENGLAYSNNTSRNVEADYFEQVLSELSKLEKYIKGD